MTTLAPHNSQDAQPIRRIQFIAAVAILILAFGVRLFAAQWWHGLAEKENRIFRFGDSASYWTLGEAIRNGQPYQYGGEDGSIFRAPGYPLLLATVAAVQPQVRAVWFARVLGCILGTIAIAIVMWIGLRIGGPINALAAGLLCAIYPGAIGMSATILSEALFMPLMLLHLFLMQQAFHAATSNEIESQGKAASLAATFFHYRWGTALLSGFLAGAAILTRPSWLLFPPLAAFIHLLINRNRIAFVQGCWVGLGIILTMAPWWYRNYLVTDRFVLTTLQVGPSLYDGLHPGASGGSDEGMKFVGTFGNEMREREARLPQPLDSTFEYRLNREMQKAATRWAVANPGESLRLAWNKFGRTWNIWPPAQELSSPWVRLTESIGCFTILGLATWGVWVSRARWTDLYLYLLPIPYFTLLHMIFVGSVRYRQPAIMAISVLAGIAVMWILNRLIQTSSGK